jgi:hypothetical protein
MQEAAASTWRSQESDDVITLVAWFRGDGMLHERALGHEIAGV